MTDVFSAKIVVDAGRPKGEFSDEIPKKTVIIEAFPSSWVQVSILEQDDKPALALLTPPMVEAMISSLQSALVMARIPLDFLD
jgi:hypothetical protein